jgi:hypothetical protein
MSQSAMLNWRFAIYNKLDVMATNLDWLWSALNANFTIAFIGGFTGAIGGALGAQFIAERMKRREERLRELRSTNAAIMTCFSICNAALMLKHQR